MQNLIKIDYNPNRQQLIIIILIIKIVILYRENQLPLYTKDCLIILVSIWLKAKPN